MIAQRFKHPFIKGIFLSFVVSEVHPFTDGNGRTSRIILNKELKQSQFSTIIIPTVLRNDYLGALRQVSLRGLSDEYYRMFLRAWKFSNINFTDYQTVKAVFTEIAFEDSKDCKNRIFSSQCTPLDDGKEIWVLCFSGLSDCSIQQEKIIEQKEWKRLYAYVVHTGTGPNSQY